MKGNAAFAFYGDDMGWIKNIAGAGFAVGIFGAVAGIWDNDDIKEAARRGTDGGFAVGEGIVEGVNENTVRILEDNGIDLSDYKNESGRLDLDSFRTALDNAGIDPELLSNPSEVEKIMDACTVTEADALSGDYRVNPQGICLD